MRKFRLVGNTPALAYLAGRLAEENENVEWWSSGFFPSLRSLRLRSESFHDLLYYFKRSSLDLEFLSRSPKIESWGTLNDGGIVLKFWKDFDEDFEDHFVDGAQLFSRLRAAAVSRGVKVRDFSASFPNPLVGLEANTCLVTDVQALETRQWPKSLNITKTYQAAFMHVQSVWFAGLPASVSAARGLAFAEWRGVQAVLEPHGEKGWNLTLCSRSLYFLDRVFQDIMNPRIHGLSEVRALFLLNGRQSGEEQYRVQVGKVSQVLPSACSLGNSIGNFHPLSNQGDDFAFRQTERFIQKTKRNRAYDDVGQLHFAEWWNAEEIKKFESELGRGRIWCKLIFSKRWGRYVIQALRYVPKTLRETLKSPA